MSTPDARLAMRLEGAFWNAYLAPAGTMQNAILLGSMRVHPDLRDSEKEVFKTAMKAAAEGVLADIGISVDHWAGERPAPEHEKGSA